MGLLAAHLEFDHVRPAAGPLLADLNDEKSVNNSRRYQFTKLLCVFIARRWAALPLAKDVVVNVVNPGLCRTEIFRELPRWLNGVTLLTAWSAEDGAKNVSRLANSCQKLLKHSEPIELIPDVLQMAWALLNDTPPGAYIDATAVGEPSAFAQSEEGRQLEADLWREMAALWVEVAPEAADVLA